MRDGTKILFTFEAFLGALLVIFPLGPLVIFYTEGMWPGVIGMAALEVIVVVFVVFVGRLMVREALERERRFR